jgi:tryptophan halogenase
VTLIESSRIPVIGVGEATTPEMVKFLHAPRFLGRSVVEFWRRVQPTCKLGIKFAWGAPPPYDFPFPFQRGRLLESMRYEGNLDAQSLGAMLMASDRVPVFEAADGELCTLMDKVRWAYHLDNPRFVAYLAEEARRAGVRYRDAQVTDAIVDTTGEGLAELVLDGGERARFDLYVDCSGFRSLLLGKALNTPFTSYSSTLFTDRAVAANIENDGIIRPYTLAETYDSGWCWNIPFHHEDHKGYVFASAFCSDDQAVAEMRAKNPGMTEPKIIRFASGRHREIFRGNVIAIGNAYGFVEPLESTALHMIVLSLEMLTTNWPASMRDTSIKRTLNRKVGDQWDALRWFLGIHYRFNRRLDTPFWRAANSEADISGAEERVALFRERAPLSYRSSLFYKVLPPDFFTDDHSFDTLMVGQKVEARSVETVEDPASWRARQAPLRALAYHALPQARALGWLTDQRSDLLDCFQQRSNSWLHTWLPA